MGSIKLAPWAHPFIAVMFTTEEQKQSVLKRVTEHYGKILGSGPVYLVTDNTDYYCLLYTSPSPRDRTRSRMPSSA